MFMHFPMSSMGVQLWYVTMSEATDASNRTDLLSAFSSGPSAYLNHYFTYINGKHDKEQNLK